MSRAAVTPKGRVLRHPGDLQWLERRRLQAAGLFARGKTRAEVAGELGVSAQTASRWYARWRDGGAAGMRTARQGKPAQLDPTQLARVRRVLDRGAVAAGFDNDLWTLARVAEVIERTTGVAHHPGHVWRLLKAMRWSLSVRPARPSSATRPRSPAGSPRSGRRSANARTRRAWLCFVDESGVKLTPPVRRTWAPMGRRPVLRHRYRRGKQLSMCGLLAYRHSDGDGEQVAAWMGFDLLESAYDTRQCIRVLDGLGHQLGHQPVTVIWDSLGAHHAGDLHAWAATQPWLELAYLPSYAPELDPVEGLWANLKGCELANRCCVDRAEVIATAQVGSIRVRRDPDLLRSFLAGTGLTL